MKKRQRPRPLAPPPQSSAIRSRKRARVATTLFHKYTRERDAAVAKARSAGCPVGDDDDCKEESARHQKLSPRQVALMENVNKWDEKIAQMGGREEYQRASQMNTSLFSTSKWVLGILGKWGWLDGLPDEQKSCDGNSIEGDDDNARKKRKKRKIPKRNVDLLEVGAINTQLLDAAARTRHQSDGNPTERVYRLDVRAIDIRSTDPRIEAMDFFDLPLPDPNNAITTAGRTHRSYDVLVNSMVINCVPNPAQRGKMLSLCYRHLRPGGVCFLTLPKLCLVQSKFMSRCYFEEILTKGVGFEILRDVGKESPKVAFFVLRRPEEDEGNGGRIREWDDRFARVPTLHKGKKFRNSFSVTLNEEEVAG
ncbi:hypothetical protein ACHAXT_009896 [Thalassiosira profunda]